MQEIRVYGGTFKGRRRWAHCLKLYRKVLFLSKSADMVIVIIYGWINNWEENM